MATYDTPPSVKRQIIEGFNHPDGRPFKVAFVTGQFYRYESIDAVVEKTIEAASEADITLGYEFSHWPAKRLPTEQELQTMREKYAAASKGKMIIPGTVPVHIGQFYVENQAWVFVDGNLYPEVSKKHDTGDSQYISSYSSPKHQMRFSPGVGPRTFKAFGMEWALAICADTKLCRSSGLNYMNLISVSCGYGLKLALLEVPRAGHVLIADNCDDVYTVARRG